MAAGTDSEAFELYAGDLKHAGEPLDGGFDGAAGGAACGDLVRISLTVGDTVIEAVTFATRAARAPAPPRLQPQRWSMASRPSPQRRSGPTTSPLSSAG